MTTAEMLARLASKERWNEIIGVSESAQLDFKQIPYKLHLTGAELEVAKFELASDVCAFANAEGGLIVVGIDARGSETNPNDVAREIAPFPFTLMDETRVHDIIKQNLSLVPVGLAVRYFPGEASDRGLVAIVIPRQTADAQPFLVRQVIFGQTAKGKAATIGSAIGLFTRVEDENTHDSIDQFVAQVRVSQRLSGKLDSVLALLANQTPRGPDSQDVLKGLEAEWMRLRAISWPDGDTEPAVPEMQLLLGCSFDGGQSIPNYFERGADSLCERMRHLPKVRESGFNLPEAEPVLDDAKWRVKSLRTSYSVARDGAIAACCDARGQLGWHGPGDNQELEHIRIRTQALVELILNFCDLAQMVRGLVGSTGAVTVAAGLAMRGVKPTTELKLVQFVNGWTDIKSTTMPSGAASTRTFSFSEWGVDDPPALMAYHLCTELFAMMGKTAEAIPFRTEQRSIDRKAIRDWR